MNFREKKAAYNTMQGKQHFEADQALLKAKNPKHAMATKEAKSEKTAEKLQREILWALLDLVSIEEIEANRKNSDTGSQELEITIDRIKADCKIIAEAASELPEKAQVTLDLYHTIQADYEGLPPDNKLELSLILKAAIAKFIAAYTGRLTAQLEAAENEAAATDIINDIIRLASILPEEASAKIIEFSQSRNPFKKSEEEIYAENITKLRNIDFEDKKTNNELVNELFDFFKLKSKNKKKASKMIALNVFIKTVPLTPEEIKATHLSVLKKLVLDKDTPFEVLVEYCTYFELKNVDLKKHKEMVWALKEFRGDIGVSAGSGAAPEQPKSSNEELDEVKEQLEETTEENEDLKAENEELQEENEDLKSEKKNTQGSEQKQENIQK